MLLVIAFGLSGCYLGHLAAGQARLLRARRPVADVVADPATPPELRARLELVGEARDFAARLGLEVGGQYTSYAEWPGDRVVTTVVATEPGSVEAAGFWFPITGRVPYKGFFDPERAAEEAARLRARGLDTCETGVAAYSTLGWLDDPVTGPMLRNDDGVVAETIVHELVHATIFVSGQADWNEGIASFIGQEASVRLFAETGREARARRARVADGRRIDAALLRFRNDVAALYASHDAGPGRDALRLGLEAQARDALRALPLETLDARDVAERLRLNDACLALNGTYAAHLDALAAALAARDGDLAAFVAWVRDASRRDDPVAALLAGR